MAAPTFVGSYSSSYTTNTSPKNVMITTQVGDVVVIYGALDDNTKTLGTPTCTGFTFTLQQSSTPGAAWGASYIWTATATNTGGLVACTVSSAAYWGYSCYVFRNSNGIGAGTSINSAAGLPAATFTTTQANSAVVFLNTDTSAQDGASRTWNTVNSITPTQGNQLERDYQTVAATYTIYGGYYNDVGAAGSITPGLSAPSGQTWSAVAIEVLGTPSIGLINTAEGGTNSTSVSPGNSGGASGPAFDAVNIGTAATVAFSNAHTAHGSLAYTIATGASVSAADLQWTTSAGPLSTVYGRFYFYATAAPGANHRLLTVATSGGAVLNSAIYWTTGRQLLMTDTAAGTLLTSTALATGAWHRVEFKIVQSATVGQVELKVFSGANMDGTTADYSGASTATQNTGSAAMAVYSFGTGFDVKANVTAFWLDDLGLSNTGYLGPTPTSAVVSWLRA